MQRGMADLLSRMGPSRRRCELPCLPANVSGRTGESVSLRLPIRNAPCVTRSPRVSTEARRSLAGRDRWSQGPCLPGMSLVPVWRSIVAERSLRCWAVARPIIAAAALVASLLTFAVDGRGQTPSSSDKNPVVLELPGRAGSVSPRFGPKADSANEAVLDLQRQINDLRSELLDEREMRIDRRQEASGTAFAVLAALVGIGGLWACAKFRSIAREARIGAAAARALATAPPSQAPGLPHAAPEFDTGTLCGYSGLAVQPSRERALLPAADGSGNGHSVGPPAGNGRGPGHATEAGQVSASPLRLGPDRNTSPAGDDSDRQRHKEAVADCTEAIRIAPDDPLLYLERGKALSELGRHEDAIADYDRSISLDPSNVAAYLSRCQARSDLGRHEEALEDYERIVSLDQNLASAPGDL